MKSCLERPWQSVEGDEDTDSHHCLCAWLVHICLLRKSDHKTPKAQTYHAGPRLLSNEGISEDLGQSAHPERNVITVLSQWTNALLQDTRMNKQLCKVWILNILLGSVLIQLHCSLPWEPAGCGWSLQSQPKCCGRCCWRLCRARFQPNRPMKICRAA